MAQPTLKLLLIVCLTLVVLVPGVSIAQDYQPLVELPFFEQGMAGSGEEIGAYIQALYLISITVAAFLAVIKIIFGGVKYMLSDVVTSKGDAKKDIQGALIGLLIVLAAVLILETINPNLSNMNILRNAQDREFSSVGSLFGWGDVVDDPILEPYLEEELEKETCAGWNDGTGDCSDELKDCKDRGGNPRSRIINGQVFCYIDKEDTRPTSCDGYRDTRGVCYANSAEDCSGPYVSLYSRPVRCYPAEDRIEVTGIDPDQPAGVKAQQCQNLGGSWYDPYCYR